MRMLALTTHSSPGYFFQCFPISFLGVSFSSVYINIPFFRLVFYSCLPVARRCPSDGDLIDIYPPPRGMMESLARTTAVAICIIAALCRVICVVKVKVTSTWLRIVPSPGI